jgi:pimeloyl-ACP methyl ester carboxylesterase
VGRSHHAEGESRIVSEFLSDGVRIAYIDTPAEAGPGGGRPVLLIHGFASNATVNWFDTGWVRHLTRAGCRVIAMDIRGHGKSEKLHSVDAYGAPLMAEDACRLLDHLGIAAADVMGYSMGARISAFLALAHPDHIRTVTFGGLGANMVRPMAGTGPIAAALEAPSIADVTNATARTFRAFAEQTHSDLKSLAACIRASREPLTREALAKLPCPVLVCVGSDDVIGGSASGLAAIIPGAEAYEIAGRDHMKAVGDRGYKEAVVDFLLRH